MSKNNATEAVNNNEDALFGDAGKVQFGYVKFEQPGDSVKGVYVGKYNSVSSKYGYTQANYVLVKKDGEKVIVSGRNAPKGSEVRIIFGMEKIPMGAVMGFIYTGDKDTGKGNQAKLIEPRYLGEKDMDTYNKFKEMYNLEEEKPIAEDSESEVETPSDEF